MQGSNPHQASTNSSLAPTRRHPPGRLRHRTADQAPPASTPAAQRPRHTAARSVSRARVGDAVLLLSRRHEAGTSGARQPLMVGLECCWFSGVRKAASEWCPLPAFRALVAGFHGDVEQTVEQTEKNSGYLSRQEAPEHRCSRPSTLRSLRLGAGRSQVQILSPR
jgi:hypothetical protein